MIKKYIENEHEEINKLIKDLSTRFGISFVDIYARLQGELAKNTIND